MDKNFKQFSATNDFRNSVDSHNSEKKEYIKKNNNGDRPRYPRRDNANGGSSFGDRKPFVRTENGDRPRYPRRDNANGGSSFGDRKPFVRTENGDRPRYPRRDNANGGSSFGDRKPFNDSLKNDSLNIKNSEDFIYGRKVVKDAIDNGVSINKVYFSKTSQGSIINDMINHCRKNHIVFSFLEKRDMDRKFGEFNQGVVAYISPKKYVELEAVISSLQTEQHSFICLLDNITDPHNTGAIIRSAFSFGAKAILIPERNSCLINSTVIKASAGAANLIDIVKIGNISNVVTQLKNNNYCIVGADICDDDSRLIFAKDLKDKIKENNICLILGSEGEGIQQHVKKNCDLIAKIDMKSNFNSLNVSCAASIIFYELSK